jgi:PAS domain S-box-containing protein
VSGDGCEPTRTGDAPASLAALPFCDAQRNLHELQTAQIELEMQNEELHRAKLELEETRARFQLKLEETWARYFELFELAPVGYLTLAENGVIVEANLTAASILGVTKCALVNQPLLNFISPEDRGTFCRHRDKIFATGTLQDCEIRMSFPGTGAAFWAHLQCAPTRTGGFRVTLADISELRRHREQLSMLVKERTEELENRNARLEVEIAERKRAEEALSRSEQRYRAVVEDQTELILRFRPDGSYTFVNQACCRFFGKSEDELLGKDWRTDAMAQDLPTIEKRLKFLTPANPVVVIENRVTSGDGDVRWMQFVNRGFFDAQGRLLETQAVARDITERKHAEEMLLIYAGEVQDLYNKAPCGYHSLDENGVFVRINDTELSWLGYQRHEIIGVKRFSDLVTAEGVKLYHTNFPKFLDQGRICDLEYQMVRKDGSRFPVIVNSEALRDADGRFLMSRGMVFDNTERRRAEDERRRSEEKLRGIFENAPFGIFQTALDGRILSVNPTMARMFGYLSPAQMTEEATDGIIGFFVHPEQRAGMLQRALAREGYSQDELEYRRKDGSHFIGQFNVRSVHSEDRTFLEGFLEDVTSRKEAEQALQKSELQFRQMADTIGQVFWLTSPVPHAVLYVSPAFERIWGRSCAELYADSRIWTEAVLPEDLPQVRRDLAELDRGNPVQLEYRIRRPDGTLRWISDRCYPQHDSSGATTFVTGVASDITKRKEAYEAREEYARRLIVLEEDLRKRIAIELHDDIGQTLTALSLNLAHIGNRLQQEAGNDLRSVFEDSRRLTKGISRSVRNLMVELHPTQLEEYGLAAAIRAHAEPFTLRTGIDVRVQADPRFPRQTAKQEIALFRITQEALNNVSKHAAATQVTVSLRCKRGSLRLSIADDGAGFEPKTALPQPTGSGWGLSIMRERAELVGGSFRVDSVPGKGTTVAIELRGVAQCR